VICLGVSEVLHLVIHGDGKRARYSGNIAADHKHHAKFANSMRETKYGCCKDGSACKREQDFKENA
jgi:hypothetical protein